MRNIIFLIILQLIAGACSDGQRKATNAPTSPLFTDLSSLESGVNFINKLPESAIMNSFVYEYYYNGGGVAIGDFNGDLQEDIFFTSNLEQNVLYINTGDLQFVDATIKAGVAGKSGWSTGVSIVDINADGRLDLYVCYSGPFKDSKLRANELFINTGNDGLGMPIFEEAALDYGLADRSNSIQAAYLDYDLDGDLDMYLLNHNPNRIPEEQLEGGRIIYDSHGDKLYENIEGKFVDVTQKSGILSNAISYGLGVGIGDFNQDGWPDIYISNDYEEMDYLYLNQKNKTFKESIKSATRHISNFSMGNDIADFDNDGYLDVMVLDMVSEDNYGIKTSMPSMNPELFHKRLNQGFHYQYMYNTLQRNTTYLDEEAVPKFTDVGQLAGVTNTGWSWAPLLTDFDNDGWKDLLITNGIKRDFRNNDFNIELNELMAADPEYLDRPGNMQEVVNKIPKKLIKNYFFKNNGDLTFENVTENWFPEITATLSNGAAYGDLDNDGDLDLVVNNIDQKATLLINNAKNNYLKVKYVGSQNNTQGIGAKLKVWVNGKFQYYENYSVRGYQSSVAAHTVVGLGNVEIVDSLEIIWPNGKLEKRFDIKANQAVTFVENEAINGKKMHPPDPVLFEKSAALTLAHLENEYDDYQKQILLPHKLSQLGPGMAVADVNGDGLQDIFLGQASGFASAIWTQTPEGRFIENQRFSEDKMSEDVDALFFDYDQDGDMDLYVVTGGNEFESGHKLYQDRLYENIDGSLSNVSDLLPNISSSGAKVKACDFNKDKLPDLLVTSRHVPGDYPNMADSYLLKNTSNGFANVTESIAPDLKQIGLVTDAEWTDFNGDGQQDMILVGEWISPVLLKQEEGKFEKLNMAALDSLTGWYSAVQSVDIDNDGDLDYLLGNLGKNYKYKATKEEPFILYYADFDQNGTRDIVLGYYNFGELFPVRGRQCSSQQVPQIKKNFSNYHSFGKSTLAQIYEPENIDNMLTLQAYNLSSGVLINNGTSFEFVAFENKVQTSSINDFLVNDFNGDGYIDVLLAGNLYESEIETPRNDAGYGMILLNNGKGKLRVLDANQSGFYLSGEIRKLENIRVGDDDFVLAGVNNERIVMHRKLQ